jgi:tRNA wybutosine-synthesizing protein 1
MNYKDTLKKQKYIIVGEHSAVHVCNWTKKALTNKGACYKEKFYRIKCHGCCQMSPWITCTNQCLHCWRPIELAIKLNDKINTPKEIIDGCVKAQRKLLTGFGGDKNTNQQKYKEAQNPSQFAISLIGEPALYPHLPELILELKKQKKTSFVVTNGLQPEAIKEMQRKSALPTQLYVSMLYPNEKLFRKITQNKAKDSWKKYKETLRSCNLLLL